MPSAGRVFAGLGIILFMLAVVYLCIEVAWGSFGVTAFNTQEIGQSDISKKNSIIDDIIGIFDNLDIDISTDDLKSKNVITESILGGIAKFPIITGYPTTKGTGALSLSKDTKDQKTYSTKKTVKDGMTFVVTIRKDITQNKKLIGEDVRIVATFLFVLSIVCGITAIVLGILIPIKLFCGGGRGGMGSARSRSRII